MFARAVFGYVIVTRLLQLGVADVCRQSVRALKGLVLLRASHSSEIALAVHACGSASPFRARCCHSSQNTVHPPPLD